MVMHFLLFLAGFLLIRRLIKLIKFTPLRQKWITNLNIISWMLWPVYAALAVWIGDDANLLISVLVLVGVTEYIRRQPDFKPILPFIYAQYPLIAISAVVGLAQLIVPDFYEEHDNYFDVAVLLGFVWIFARWTASAKQQAELKMASLRNAELDRLVEQRTAELTKQTTELQETIKLLQTTQQQLIQSEKLASLGELTAGIAHEIQNPLNFVNNFSDVSIELIDEMEEELAKGDKDEAIAIAADIKQNLDKIRYHGKRADGIVKGMLQHSRASSNVMEPTDINTLADEYLRLAYHGLRAKDKSFNAELITHFEQGLAPVNVVPQDVGRVLLNLFNNAFYAVQQKQKSGLQGFKPTVEVTTARKNNALEIKVKDNGTGIPDEIKDKILQPFFTTKPTGEGTGLGLSLSYDIIIKAHNGTIDINSREGEFTEFIISIPG